MVHRLSSIFKLFVLFIWPIHFSHLTNILRMKKVAPEVRMTEAARKRSAKIRQDKESAENKGPASPRLRTPITQLPRVKNTENRTKELALEENINFLSLIRGHFHNNEIRIFLGG